MAASPSGSDTTTVHKFNLPILTEEALADFVRVCFGVRIPDVVVVPGHSTPWRAFCDSFFARNNVVVWKASRGFGGKSFLLALLSLTEALALKADVRILGGSGKQSQKVQEYISETFYNSPNSPRKLWKGEPLTTISRFVWGNSIEALTASQNSARGPHIPRLRGDEIDEMDLSILDAAMGQTMAKVDRLHGTIIIPANTTLSSTHHNPKGTMTEVLKRAEEKGWAVHEWSYKESEAGGKGWLLPSEIEQKKEEITTAMWVVEYDLQEPSPEGRAIMTEYVEAMFDPALGEFEGELGEYIEIETPQADASYVTGADWAKSQDWTIIVTFRTDVNPIKLVAFERRGREPWPVMIERFDSRMARFAGSGKHDETGVGGVVADYIKTDHNVQGVNMVGSTRTSMLTRYCSMIEGKSIVAPRIKWMYEEHLYVTTNDLYGSGHCPDTIAAGALACLARNSSRHTGKAGSLSDRKKEPEGPEGPKYVTLRYKGEQRISMPIGRQTYMLEKGWQRGVEQEIAEGIAQRFPAHFEVANG